MDSESFFLPRDGGKEARQAFPNRTRSGGRRRKKGSQGEGGNGGGKKKYEQDHPSDSTVTGQRSSSPSSGAGTKERKKPSRGKRVRVGALPEVEGKVLDVS